MREMERVPANRKVDEREPEEEIKAGAGTVRRKERRQRGWGSAPKWGGGLHVPRLSLISSPWGTEAEKLTSLQLLMYAAAPTFLLSSARRFCKIASRPLKSALQLWKHVVVHDMPGETWLICQTATAPLLPAPWCNMTGEELKLDGFFLTLIPVRIFFISFHPSAPTEWSCWAA